MAHVVLLDVGYMRDDTGAFVGDETRGADGRCLFDGDRLGFFGDEVGCLVGDEVGCFVGGEVGCLVGDAVGCLVDVEVPSTSNVHPHLVASLGNELQSF
jgi:hypothetical protein